MKTIKILIILITTASAAFSQPTNSVEIEAKVNNELWKPFKEAFENRDAQTFNALHTDDVLRVSKWGIKAGDEYKNSVSESYAKKGRPDRTIDFWLEHRIYKGDIGYEVGYYRIAYQTPEGENKESYARFHVVLRRENGQWKIAQDWDTNEINGNPVTKEDFDKGTPLNL